MSGFTSTRLGEKAYVVLEPHLTRSQVQAMQPILLREIASGAAEFEFDCAQLTVLDGAGLALIIALEERLKGKGRLRLKNANPVIRELMTHLHMTARLQNAAEAQA